MACVVSKSYFNTMIICIFLDWINTSLDVLVSLYYRFTSKNVNTLSVNYLPNFNLLHHTSNFAVSNYELNIRIKYILNIESITRSLSHLRVIHTKLLYDLYTALLCVCILWFNLEKTRIAFRIPYLENHWGSNILVGWGCLRRRCWGGYSDQRGMKWWEGWRKPHNEDLPGLYPSPSKIRTIMPRRIWWAGNVTRMREERNEYRLLWESQRERDH
jgi:hypothetical protein